MKTTVKSLSLLLMLLLVSANLVTQISWAVELIGKKSTFGGVVGLVVLAPYILLVFLCIKYHRLIDVHLSRAILLFNVLFILVFLSYFSLALVPLLPISLISSAVLGGSGVLVNSLLISFFLEVILIFYLVHNINKQGRFNSQRPTVYLLFIVAATIIHLLNIYVFTGIEFDRENIGGCGPTYEITPLVYSGNNKDICLGG